MKRRTEREREASRLRARLRRRRLLGWPEDRLEAPPRAYVRGGGVSSPASGPPPPSIDRHPLVEAALRELRPYEAAEVWGTFDAIGRDLVGAYCLAVLSGADPRAAVQAERAAYQARRRWCVYGTALADGLER